MTISELITKLQVIQNEHGDVVVKAYSDDAGTMPVSDVEYKEAQRLKFYRGEEDVVVPAYVVLYAGD